MLLRELFDTLATGELSQHQMGIGGVIPPDKYPTIINQLNKGLTSLHSYFPLSEKEVIVQQFDQITEYKLTAKYALTTDDDTVPHKWIIDTDAAPYLEDIIRIERVYDELGRHIPLNDEYDTNSLFTTAWDTIQIPYPSDANAVVIIYRAKHPRILANADPDTTRIEIPPSLEEALQAFIASRVFVSLGNQASASLATYYSNRYQQQVDHVERNNLLQSAEGDSNLGLTQKGFF